MPMRSWVMLSRSRTVTAWSSRVSKSTVMQYGVPISSWRRYRRPIALASSKSVFHRLRRAAARSRALGVRRLVLGVGVEQEGQRAAVDAGGRLDHERDKPLPRLLVQVGHVLLGRVLVGGQVVIGAVGDALELSPLAAGEAEPVLDVHRALGV